MDIENSFVNLARFVMWEYALKYNLLYNRIHNVIYGKVVRILKGV